MPLQRKNRIFRIKNKGPHSLAKHTFLKTKAFPVALKKIKSSLTIEAAIALPLFLFFVIAIIYFLMIISLQTNIQIGMDEAARSIGKKIYLANRLDEIGKTEADDKTSEADIDDETRSLASVGINSLTLKTWILKGNLFNKVSNSKIVGGIIGFDTSASAYDEDEGVLDIVVNYTYNIPFLPTSISNVKFVQRSKTHVWTGREIKLGIGSSGTKKQTVYVTQTGTVYHTSKTCPYLDLSISLVSYKQIDSLRNKLGGKYYKCSECAKYGKPDMVYITDYGTKWHTSADCSGLKRTIIEKDISEVGDMHECSKCSGH